MNYYKGQRISFETNDIITIVMPEKYAHEWHLHAHKVYHLGVLKITEDVYHSTDLIFLSFTNAELHFYLRWTIVLKFVNF